MQFGLIVIAGLIANLHAAVFYMFFILLMPYIGEYLFILVRDSYFTYKLEIKRLKKKIEKLTQKEKTPEEISKVQDKLLAVQAKFESVKIKREERKENPYKLKLVKKDAAKWLLFIAVLCFVAGLLTPLGDEPYTHLFKLLSGETTKGISEHQPIVLANSIEVIGTILIIFGILIFTDTKIRLKDFFMIGGLLILTFMSRRQFSLLLIIGGISIETLICDFVNKRDTEGAERVSKFMVTWAGKILTVVLIVLASYTVFIRNINAEYISEHDYPVYLADYMIKEKDAGNLNFENMKIYNEYNYGSYLLYRGIPVFIDSRADLYSPEFNEGCHIFDDSMAIASLSGGYYNDGLNYYGITHVITYKNSKLNTLLSRDEKYKELYSDKRFVLYERKAE